MVINRNRLSIEGRAPRAGVTTWEPINPSSWQRHPLAVPPSLSPGTSLGQRAHSKVVCCLKPRFLDFRKLRLSF